VVEELQGKEPQLDRPSPYALDTQKVTAPDLLAYALLGNPNASPTAENLALRKQFKQQKIHPLDNADTKIKRLTYDFTTDAAKVLEDAGFTLERRPLIVEEIRTRASFSRLTRMLSMLSSTTKGCKFLAENGHAVADGIRRCRKQQGREGRVRTRAVLQVLNNLILNFRSKGVELDPHLCTTALYHASKKLDFALIRRYLEDKSYQTTEKAIAAMNAMVVSHRRGTHVYSSLKQRLNKDEQSREVLRLLTGWDSGGISSPSKKRQACFASGIVSETKGDYLRSMFKEYFVALGYVGASDALWHEWESVPEDGRLGRHTENNDFRGIAEIFALAFLMAEDRNRALLVLKSSLKHDLIMAEGRPSQEPMQLGSQTRAKIMWYYRSNHMTLTKRLQKRLAKVFPENPETILQAIDDLLVPDWIRFINSKTAPEFHFYDIDWVEKDGVEGIAIMKGDEIVHFKPSSRQTSSQDTAKSSDPSSFSTNEQ
jgi:hypothetical protein